MAEEKKQLCRKCGQEFISAASEDWCPNCYPNPDSTQIYSQSAQSTLDPSENDGGDASGPGKVEIRDYQLLRPLGRGGMGIVYLARQLSAGRLVALKMILNERLDGLSAEKRQRAIERFVNESRAAAQLNHENIVTVFDVGESDGRHYYTMRFVDGVSLSSMLKNGPLSNRSAARYVEAIARAVHDAHRAGVLHRDLKPANVLVDKTTDRPLVADFGLAKLLTSDTEMTMTGEIFGSPPYMSPEQAKSAGDVTASADIYSLGATLYHLLAGRPPFQAASVVETLRQVVQDEPVSPRVVNPAVDIDLETIALKCLHKDPDRRYPTALSVSEDLVAYLEGRTITARPATTWDRLTRWRRRNPALAVWMSIAAVLLIIGTAVSSTLAVMENTQRGVAEANETRAKSNESRANLKTEEAVKLAGQLKDSLDRVEQQRHQARRDAFTSSISASFAYLQNAEPERIGDRLNRLQLTDDEIKTAGFEYHYLNRIANFKPRLIPAHTAAVNSVAFSRDGSVIASGGDDFVVELWNSQNGEHLRTLQSSVFPIQALAFSPDNTHLAAGTANTSSSDFETRVDIWDYQKGLLVRTLPHHGSVWRIAFSPNGNRMITATADINEMGELRVYDTGDWSLFKKLDGHTKGNPGHLWGISDVAVHWDGNQLASAGFEGKVRLWDIDKEVEVKTLSGHSGWVRSIAYDSTCKSIVSGSDDQTLRFWNTQDGQPIQTLRDAVGITTTLFHDRSYRNLIAVSEVGILKWDLASQQATALGAPRVVNDAALSFDGRMLAAGRPDGQLEVWDYEASGKSLRLPHEGWVDDVAFSRDGSRLATGSGQKSVTVYDLKTRTQIFKVPDQKNFVTEVWFSPDARYLVSKCDHQAKNRSDLSLWNAQSGEPLRELIDREDIGIDHIAFSKMGPICAVERHHIQHLHENAQVAGGGYIEVWDLENKQQVSQIAAEHAEDSVFQFFCFSDDGTTLFASSQKTLDAYAVATGELVSSSDLGRVLQSIQIDGQDFLVLTTLPDTSQEYGLKKIDASKGTIEELGTLPSVQFVAVSPDGRWLALSHHKLNQSQLMIWDCQNQREHFVLRSHQNKITDAVFVSDGRTLVTVSLDKTIRFWDVASRQELGVIRDHTQLVYSVDISRDGNWLVTGGGDPYHGIGSGQHGELLLWNAVPFVPAEPKPEESLTEKLWKIENVDSLVNDVAFSQDGQSVAIAYRFPHQAAQDSPARLVEIRDTNDGRLMDSLSPFRDVTHVCLSVDGTDVAMTKRLDRVRTFTEKDGKRVELPPPPDPQTVLVHKVGSPEPGFSFDVGFEEAHAVRFSTDGHGLIVAGSEGHCEYWNLRDRKLLYEKQLHLNRIEVVDVSPDGKWLALGGEIRPDAPDTGTGVERIVIVDLQTGDEVIRLSGHQSPVNDLRFSSTGSFLAASSGYRSSGSSEASRKKIIVWKTSDWTILSDLNLPPTSSLRISFSQDDRFLAAGAGLRTYAILETDSKRWRTYSDPDPSIRRFGGRVSNDGWVDLLDWKDGSLTAKRSVEVQRRMSTR